MNATLIATLAGLATALAWGTGDWISSKSAKKLHPIEVSFGQQMVGSSAALVLWIAADVHLPHGWVLFRIALSTALIMSAYLIFLKALSFGAIGIIAPIGNSYPIVTVGLSVLLLSAHFSSLQFGGMLAIIGGGLILAYEKNSKNIPYRELHKETILAVLAALIWGVGFFVLGPVVTAVSWQSVSVTSEIFATIFNLFLFFGFARSNVTASVKRTWSYKPLIPLGLFGTLGAVMIYVGGDYGHSILIPTVLSAGGPLIASFWGAAIDKERIGTIKRVGAIIVVAGIVVLNLN